MKLKIIKHIKVKSTNDEAIKLIKKNKINPTLISAEKQTKGRGTMGKKWISQKGNLFVSIFFRVDNKKIKFNQFTILNPYIIKKMLSKYLTHKISIKLPNDLMIRKNKISGILQELIEFKNKKFLIIGIGINTILSPINRNFKSTSLNKFSDKKIENDIILLHIKKEYEKLLSDINKYDFFYLKRKVLKFK